MSSRTCPQPIELDDVRPVLKEITDPHATLFNPEKSWILVKNVDTLERLESESRATDFCWMPDRVAVVCLHVVHQRPSLTHWIEASGNILYVHNDQIQALPEGPVDDQHRFRLADLALSPSHS